MGANEGAVVVVSTRPSEGSFPSGSCTRLYNTLMAVGITEAHISDIVKFRGPNDERAVNWPMWEMSFDCIVAEFDAVGPSAVLIVPEARKWVTAWLGHGFGRWAQALTPAHRRLLRWLDDTAVDVPFWGGNARRSNLALEQAWQDGLAEAQVKARPWLRRSGGI